MRKLEFGCGEFCAVCSWCLLHNVAGKTSTPHTNVLPQFLFGLLLAAGLRRGVFVLRSFIGRLAEGNGRGVVAGLGAHAAKIPTTWTA